MKITHLLKLEEAALFILGIYLFSLLDYPWWIFPLLLLAPDIGMIGYLINPKIGAYTYNFTHFTLTAVLLIIAGFIAEYDLIALIGIIMFSHIAMDRALGFGLKYRDDFKNTHLGRLS